MVIFKVNKAKKEHDEVRVRQTESDRQRPTESDRQRQTDRDRSMQKKNKSCSCQTINALIHRCNRDKKSRKIKKIGKKKIGKKENRRKRIENRRKRIVGGAFQTMLRHFF